jgi:hypothetical protein
VVLQSGTMSRLWGSPTEETWVHFPIWGEQIEGMGCRGGAVPAFHRKGSVFGLWLHHMIASQWCLGRQGDVWASPWTWYPEPGPEGLAWGRTSGSPIVA